MNIIAHKTDFYLTDEFFRDIITKEYVDGVSLDVVLNSENRLLVYNYKTIGDNTIGKIQNLPLNQVIQSNILILEDALELIYENRRNIPIYLNLIPNILSIESDEDLKALNKRNMEYIMEINRVLKRYSNLNIKMHSISRNLVLLLKKEFLKNEIGFVVSTGDLTYTDVSYYVFPTYMIDDNVFRELRINNKGIVIYIDNEGDLAVVTEKYNSGSTSDFSNEVLRGLSFIIDQPILLDRIFRKS